MLDRAVSSSGSIAALAIPDCQRDHLRFQLPSADLRQAVKQQICVFERHAAFFQPLARRHHELICPLQHLPKTRAPI